MLSQILISRCEKAASMGGYFQVDLLWLALPLSHQGFALITSCPEILGVLGMLHNHLPTTFAILVHLDLQVKVRGLSAPG